MIKQRDDQLVQMEQLQDIQDSEMIEVLVHDTEKVIQISAANNLGISMSVS